MLRAKNFLHVILPERNGQFIASKVRCIGYSKEDFEKVIITKRDEELEPWTKLKMIANERSTKEQPSNINAVDLMARAYRSKPKTSISQWKKKRMIFDNYVYDKNIVPRYSMGNRDREGIRKQSHHSNSTDKEAMKSSKSFIHSRKANINADTSRLKREKYIGKHIASKHSSYDKDNQDIIDQRQFWKLMEKQKEAPFIFTTVAQHRREIDIFLQKLSIRLKAEKRDGRSFPGLGIERRLTELLHAHNITKPLPVQIESIPEILRGKSVIIESVTGSGKTLSFLLPMIQQLDDQSCSNLIIVPTRELATQIYKEALKYGMDKSTISRHVSGVDDAHDKKLSHALKDSKIMIGTPKKLLEIMESNGGYFRQVRRIVIDEADKLLPISRSRYTIGAMSKNISKVKPTEKIIAMVRHYRKATQMIATSATILNNLVLELQEMGFDKATNLKLVPDSFSHGKVPENIKHFFTMVPDGDSFSKLRFFSRLFELSKEKSVLLFINRSESVEVVVDELKDMGLNAKALYKELLLPAPAAYENFLNRFREGEIEVVVSTEETVRGIDFPFLNDIYLTFIPDTPEQYLHIAGRVGRLGRPGRVTTLIGKSNAATDRKHLKRRLFVLGVKGRLLEL